MKMKKYSELRDPKRPSLERLLPLSFPLSLFIETTNRCNFRCRYCPMAIPEYPKISGGFQTMNMLEFEQTCQQIQMGRGVKVLRMGFMGEPLVNPLLPEMITLACQMKLAERTEVTTNAVLLNKEKSAVLIASGLDYIRISISSVYQHRHEYITQTNVLVDQIYNNLEKFRQIRDSMGRQRPFLYIKMLDSFDDTENAKFLEMYRDVADEVVIEKPMNWNSYQDYDLLEDIYKGKQIPDSTELYPYPKEVCPYPFYTLVVNVNGDVTVCCVDWNKATCVGNLFKTTLKSIWEGEALRTFRRMHIERRRGMNPSCRHCQFLFTVPDNLDHMAKSKIQAMIGVGSM